jgi:hypothetical protein
MIIEVLLFFLTVIANAYAMTLSFYSGRVKFHDFLRALRVKTCTLSEEVSYPEK